MERHPPAPSHSAAPTAFERWLLRRGLAAPGRPPLGVILWNGEEVRVSEQEPVARLRLHDRAALRSLLRGSSLALGDAYADGRVEVEGDLARLVEAGFRANERASRWTRALGRLASLRPRRNTLRRSRHNIHHHYDLGNDFYSLWLDERMLYTCAYFARPEADLEEAQLAKMEHVGRKLRLRPGERVVEAGCGWGSLALHLAERYGVRVRAFNVSGEQIRWAREKARAAGLADRVEFVQDDYRNVTGRFDAFVSVGMLEHVGPSHYKALGRVIDRSLAPHGRGLLHSIGRTRPQPMNPWMERNIFPGAYIPSLREMLVPIESRRLAVLDVENLRMHYARTLEHWLDRFEKAADGVERMYDVRFVRTWRLYLACSIAAFRTGSCQLFQIVFARGDNDAIPWTRAGLYAHALQGGSPRR